MSDGERDDVIHTKVKLTSAYGQSKRLTSKLSERKEDCVHDCIVKEENDCLALQFLEDRSVGSYLPADTNLTIMIALKGTIRDFSQSPNCAANCLQRVRSSGPGIIVCKLRATHRAFITWNILRAIWHEGTAQLQSLTEFKSRCFLNVVLLAEPLRHEGLRGVEEGTEVPGENPRQRASANAKY